MESKLLKLQEDNDLQALQNYVKGLSVDLICSELCGICSKEDGVLALQALLSGLQATASCHEKRLKISRTILQQIERKIASSQLSEKLLCVLATQVESFSADNIITLVDFCLRMMRDSNEIDGLNCWKDFLPKLLNKIIEFDYIDHNGSRISGQEYKNEVVIAICITEWPSNIITNVASMFVEISLSTEEHLKVIKKLCKGISSVNPQEIPPLVHQILQLTKEDHFMPLYLALEEFFNNELYSNLQNENNTLPKMNENKLKEILTVEGTVLYHVYSTVSSLGPQSVKEFLKTLKECLNSPQFFLSPFSVTFLLTISCVSFTFEEEVLNILKGSIFRNFIEEEKLLESAWIETVTPSCVNVYEMFNKIIYNCFRDRDKVIRGLINLGFWLLGTVKTRVNCSYCEKMWKLGNFIFLKLIQKHGDVTNSILQTLSNQISQVHESKQYTDCLFHIVRKNPLNLLDCSNILVQLLDNICARLPGNVGQRVVSVILPLTKMSHSLRDNLIIVLRKSLFPHDRACREMAVTGILELLKDLKISNLKNLSQSMSQNYCGLTQIYSETHAGPGPSHTNEGICLELLSILREVFKHQQEVKTIFYRGLYEAVYVNPELGYHVLDSLQNQFDKYFIPGSDVPPLHFDKIVIIQGTAAVLQEPLAELVLSVGLIVAKMDEESVRCSKLRDMFNSLCERMAECDVPHFLLGKLCDGSLESLVEEEKIQQILGVYEALMGYLLSTWTINSPTNGQKLNSLFKGYTRLSDYVRGLGKPERKKQEEKGKNKKSTETKGKRKEKSKVFTLRLPVTVLNLKCACRLLSLLYEPVVSWATEESLVSIKNKRELHRYCLAVILTLIKQSQQMSLTNLSRNSSLAGYLTKIGKVLFTRCVKRISHMKEFDLQCAVSSLECFSELLNLVLLNFKPQCSKFFSDISGLGAECGNRVEVKTILDEILDQLNNVLKDDQDTEVKEEEVLLRKLLLLLISCASTLATQLPRSNFQTQQILDKTKAISRDCKMNAPNVAKAILNLLMTIYNKCKPSGGLLLDLTLCLTDYIDLIDDEVKPDDHPAYAIINASTCNACLIAICDSLRFYVNDIEWIISRLKAELLIGSFSLQEPQKTRQEEIFEKERELCRHINFSAKVLSTLCSLVVPPGIYADSILKELGNFYNMLTMVAKYFITKVGKYHLDLLQSKFDKTVKIIDQELTKNMYCFTDHVIAEGIGGSEDNGTKQLKKDPAFLKNKCLRETKIIPKVIYEKEQFQKFILQLSKKSKVDLVAQTKHALTRDYRLYAKQVKEILEKENVQVEEPETDEESQQNDESESQSSKRQRLSD